MSNDIGGYGTGGRVTQNPSPHGHRDKTEEWDMDPESPRIEQLETPGEFKIVRGTDGEYTERMEQLDKLVQGGKRYSVADNFSAAPGEEVRFHNSKKRPGDRPLSAYQTSELLLRGWTEWPAVVLGKFTWTRQPGDFGPYAEEGDNIWYLVLEEISRNQPDKEEPAPTFPEPTKEWIEAEARRRFSSHHDGSIREGWETIDKIAAGVVINRAPRYGYGQDANPKDKSAVDKVPMWSLPAIGAVHGAMATGEGIRKGHGPFNWRDKPISMNEHLAAIERHLLAIKDGEDYVRDCEGRQVTHLGALIAGATIILDARQCDTLIDDRPKVGKSTSSDELEAYHERNKR